MYMLLLSRGRRETAQSMSAVMLIIMRRISKQNNHQSSSLSPEPLELDLGRGTIIGGRLLPFANKVASTDVCVRGGGEDT